MSINLSAISVLNDAVGGVNVQVIGDLTSVDPTLKEGANVTLLGGQAETYVRSENLIHWMRTWHVCRDNSSILQHLPRKHYRR